MIKMSKKLGKGIDIHDIMIKQSQIIEMIVNSLSLKPTKHEIQPKGKKFVLQSYIMYNSDELLHYDYNIIKFYPTDGPLYLYAYNNFSIYTIEN